MIDYVGDLSRNDAEILRVLARQSRRILEFGCGASTQIFAAFGAGPVHSVETDPAWIEKTQRNILALDLKDPRISKHPVVFHPYETFSPDQGFDLMFVDGIDELRQEFAISMWPFLEVGGRMCFHDTRRTRPHGVSPTSDVQNVCALIERYSPEIDSVAFNLGESNTTVVSKRAPLLLEDWNVAEGRTDEQIGIA